MLTDIVIVVLLWPTSPFFYCLYNDTFFLLKRFFLTCTSDFRRHFKNIINKKPFHILHLYKNFQRMHVHCMIEILFLLFSPPMMKIQKSVTARTRHYMSYLYHADGLSTLVGYATCACRFDVMCSHQHHVTSSTWQDDHVTCMMCHVRNKGFG